MSLKAYAITFDLRDKSHNYSDLYSTVKSIGEWKHPQEPLWIVVVDNERYNANKIFDLLKPNLQPTDMLFISDITKMDRQGWMPNTAWDLLKRYEL